MKSDFKKFLKLLARTPKTCVLCESWVFFKAPLCKACRKYLYREYLKTEFEILNLADYPCYFLWKWTSNNEIWIQKIIVAMKDGDNCELYQIFMPWLVRKIRRHPDLNWVVAIPSFDRKHPQALCRAFRKYYPQTSIFELIKVEGVSQKYQTKSERLNTAFKPKTDKALTEICKHQKILVLDDVVATGGSFRGVARALEGKNLQLLAVWAYRTSRNN